MIQQKNRKTWANSISITDNLIKSIDNYLDSHQNNIINNDY